MTQGMEVRRESQLNVVADEVSAITAVVRPILVATLHALKTEVVAEAGGVEDVKLKMLARLYRPGDGDCGISFEYAVHDAMRRNDPVIVDRISDALSRHCRVPGDEPASILFGLEKTGAEQLIDTASSILTADSALLYGTRGRPVKLRRHLNSIAAAFRRPQARKSLPQSISGLWKADLFLGHSDADRWVGTSVKINRSHLEPARGLRVGIVPTRQGASDRLERDERKNLVICPLPHDGSFMEVFYRGWGVVQQFIAADAQLPSEVALPMPADRQVARYLSERRDFPVTDVVDALSPLAQPELLKTQTHDAQLVLTRGAALETGVVLAPQGRVAT